MKLIFVHFIQLALLVGCSTVRYRSSGRIPINLLKDEVHRTRRLLTVEGVAHLYLWGMIPSETVVNLDQLVKGSEVTYLEAVRVHEYRSFKNVLMSWLTLGMYVPLNYEVTAVADLADSRWIRGSKWQAE